MSSWDKLVVHGLLLAGAMAWTGVLAAGESPRYGFGSALSETEISSWDIDVGPDGAGLPPGSGTAAQGEALYLAQCAACHGEFGEGVGRYPALLGTRASLVGERTRKTVGGYWPYATTLWDYINRAMPFGNAQSLSPDQVYALTAYVLALNEIVAEDAVLDAHTLPAVRMPNRDGFVVAKGPDIKAAACMHDCAVPVKVVGRAARLDGATVGE